MSKTKKVTVYQDKPAGLSKTAWLIAIPILLAVLKAAGVDVGDITQGMDLPSQLLPGTLLSVGVAVLVKIATMIYFSVKKKVEASVIDEDS